MNIRVRRGVLMSASCHAKEGVTRYAKPGKGTLGNIRECQEVIECARHFRGVLACAK